MTTRTSSLILSRSSALLARQHAARTASQSQALLARRSFQSSAPRLETPPVVVQPVRRPVGAFRGGFFGFLLGSTLAGAGVYYYILEEYRVSNELLTEDIYALQAAVQRIETYTRSLEEKVDSMQKRK